MEGLDGGVVKPSAEDACMKVISRKEWGAHPPTEEITQMLTPFGNIRFTHTATESCSNFTECKKLLKKIQFKHMDTLGHPDITYNFMIGGDGCVYEGRGWTTEPDRPAVHHDLAGASLEVAYIGDFDEVSPPPELMKVAFELIICAIKTNILTHYFDGIHLT